MRLHRAAATVLLSTFFYTGRVCAWPRPGGDDAPDEANKYFHEPGEDDYLHHYDARFFKEKVSYEEREETLHHMIRAYLNFFREKSIETWIAHGTLLGWWWNGKILPWDWDLDTQVSGATLEYLGKHFNQTAHHYESDDGKIQRDYLLDVNPWSWQREFGDGMNIIDARWIDTHNGLFIDITGLSETHPDKDPGVWSCKNLHKYRTKDLYPLRESTYEGVPALIPYAYDQMLMEEYEPKALVLTEYENHRWEPALKEWIKRTDDQTIVARDVPTPHIPRSVQSRSSATGLRNIFRLLGGS